MCFFSVILACPEGTSESFVAPDAAVMRGEGCRGPRGRLSEEFELNLISVLAWCGFVLP